MFFGKRTDEIIELEKQYEEVIGVKIFGEMGFEICEEDSDLYVMMLKECIDKKETIFELIDELEAKLAKLDLIEKFLNVKSFDEYLERESEFEELDVQNEEVLEHFKKISPKLNNESFRNGIIVDLKIEKDSTD